MANVNLPICRILISLCLLALLSSLPISAQTIQLDNTFGSAGRFTVGFGETGFRDSSAHHVFIQPSGRIVVSGSHVNEYLGASGTAACGLTSAGLLDPGFGTGGKFLEMNGSQVRAIEPLSNGQFLRVRIFFLTSIYSVLNRINQNGSVDNSLMADLDVGADAVPVSVNTRSDGRILVLLRGIGGDESQWLVRLNPDGTRDTSFGTNGVLLLNLRRLSRFLVVGVHVLPDHRILLGGYLSTNPGVFGGNVVWAALLDEHGHYDRRFGLQGLTRLTLPFGIRVSKTLLQPDGKLVLVGNASPGMNSQFLIVRLTRRGRPDPGFGQNGIAIAPNITPGSLDVGYSGALMSDGRIVAVGTYAASQTSAASFLVARFGATGLRESHAVTAFTPDQNSFAHDVAIQPDGKLVVAGSTRNPDASANGNLFAVARYTQ